MKRVDSRADFALSYQTHREAYEVLCRLYSSHSFTKKRFLGRQRKRKFEMVTVNKAIDVFRAAVGGMDDYIIAYGDGKFSLSTKGVERGGCTHRQLAILLAKK